MPRAFTPKVVTANDLLEGDVVYLTAADEWSRDMSAAEFIEDEAHAQIRLIDAQIRSGEIVGAYLADAVAGASGPEPKHFREAFRAAGPSDYIHGRPELDTCSTKIGG